MRIGRGDRRAQGMEPRSDLEGGGIADVVLVLTEWREFRSLDPVEAAALVATPTVIDGRNCLPADDWREAGWTYLALGRG